MHPFDYSLIVFYLVAVLVLGFVKRLKRDSSASEMILGGRMLTLPAFVASLVSTWYGGILGVGEYSYSYGLSNWLVFGLPYYLAALVFALFLARKARQSKLLTIPDRLAQAYGDKTAAVGSVIIFLMTIPAAYVLMLGVLAEQLFGWPFWVGVVAGSLLSVVYVYMGGFKSVVRTDLLQFGLMFLGFAVLLGVLVAKYGFFDFLAANLPATHLTWHGGNSGWYIATWYVIALATLVEPAFYQRCYAAKTETVARNGIFISIACWAIFDFMTTTCGLYARAILPNLANPVSSYPALALAVLPVGLLGLFMLAILATVMSTVDSYSFLAATTFGNDILRRFGLIAKEQITRYSRIGLVLTTILAVLMALFFRSVVEIWYVFGSIGTPALLLPVWSAFRGRRQYRPGWALWSIILSGGISLVWWLSQYLSATGEIWYGVKPIFPGLIVSFVIYILGTKNDSRALPKA
ncbi:MAG: sodium:solute symporter family protein [candidate division Zixibacteria bacterium]|nr:sodium:solute symporter family protein [candidate division Zixibacteria bacterium]